MAQQVSIRSAVFESLHYILSSTKAEREAGEEKLKALEVTEGNLNELVILSVCVTVCVIVCVTVCVTVCIVDNRLLIY